MGKTRSSKAFDEHWIVGRSTLSRDQKHVLHWLIIVNGRDNIFISAEELAALCSMHRTKLTRIFRELTALGVHRVEQRGGRIKTKDGFLAKTSRRRYDLRPLVPVLERAVPLSGVGLERAAPLSGPVLERAAPLCIKEISTPKGNTERERISVRGARIAEADAHAWAIAAESMGFAEQLRTDYDDLEVIDVEP